MGGHIDHAQISGVALHLQEIVAEDLQIHGAGDHRAGQRGKAHHHQRKAPA